MVTVTRSRCHALRSRSIANSYKFFSLFVSSVLSLLSTKRQRLINSKEQNLSPAKPNLAVSLRPILWPHTQHKNTMTIPKISQKSKSSSRVTAGAPNAVPTTIDCSNNSMSVVEACRRSSMASSISDSGDYQNPPESLTVSPFQRRASGPSNKPTIDRKSLPQLPAIRRDDSWGNLSIEDML